jgi:hypothetical protein
MNAARFADASLRWQPRTDFVLRHLYGERLLIPMPAPHPRTRLIEPGERTTPRTTPTRDGLLDVRTLPLDLIPESARHIAVAAVGAELGTQFEGYEITAQYVGPPGAVVISYGAATTPGSAPDHVSIIVGLVIKPGHVATAALWPALGYAWPEIVRTTVVFAAQQQAGGIR